MQNICFRSANGGSFGSNQISVFSMFVFKNYANQKEPPKWMWLAVKILGKRISPWAYYWRESYWITGNPPLDTPLDQYPSNKSEDV